MDLYGTPNFAASRPRSIRYSLAPASRGSMSGGMSGSGQLSEQVIGW
jgi:hypothetical protein